MNKKDGIFLNHKNEIVPFIGTWIVVEIIILMK